MKKRGDSGPAVKVFNTVVKHCLLSYQDKKAIKLLILSILNRFNNKDFS